ncbi:MAG: hypothetical protein AAFR47_02240 [Pseudomonadota bacterium]
MAYDPTGLFLSGYNPERPRNPKVWFYRSEDAPSLVVADGYIADAFFRGMQVGDVVHIQDFASGAPVAHTISIVLAVTEAGGANLSDGTSIDLTDT